MAYERPWQGTMIGMTGWHTCVAILCFAFHPRLVSQYLDAVLCRRRPTVENPATIDFNLKSGYSNFFLFVVLK